MNDAPWQTGLIPHMKTFNCIQNRVLRCALLTLGLLAGSSLQALESADVPDFGDVFVISGQVTGRERVEVTWDIAKDYYLYNNRFLRFSSQTPGVVLGEPEIPRGNVSFDELLGEEVEKYHGHLTVSLPIRSMPAGISAFQLQVRSQGCLENVLCYPPTDQVLLLGLPAETAGAATLSEAPALSSESASAFPWPPGSGPAETAVEPLLDPVPGRNGPALQQPAFAGLASNPLAGLTQNAGEAVLDAESAFAFEVIGLNADTALARFTAQPGYYLYHEQFRFRVLGDSGFEVREASVPSGVIKDDPEFGAVEVIFGQIEVPVRLNRPAGAARTITLEADFQGCRDGEICYPPQARALDFEMPASTTAIDLPLRSIGDAVVPTPARGTPPRNEQDRLASLLIEHPGRAVIAFFIAGILLAFTPCVFPMVPILSGIIAGQGERLTTLRAFWLSLVYVLAMALTYTVAGVLAGLFGQNLQVVFQNPWILSAFVGVFVLLALSMFGFYELQLPGRLQTRLVAASNQQQGGSLWGVAVMGFLSALIVGPCVAPPLMAALIVIGASGDAVLGGGALFALSLGMGVPLILFGVSAGKLVPRAGAWMNAIKAVFGVGLLAVAIWLLERILPGGLIMLLWGSLAIACGVYLGALERLPEGASGWWRLWKSVGVMLLLAGALELIGAAAGGDYWLRPLESLRGSRASPAAVEHVAFRRIKSIGDLDAAIAVAKRAGKGAMLDFYADWCVECIRMERNTFSEPGVQTLLDRLQPLQADVTPNDAVDQALMKRFGIVGPPAILFFDRQGQELTEWRLVGYFNPEEFSGHLAGVLAAQ